MADLREAAQQALEALVARGKRGDDSPDTVAALRAALAQQEQAEPVLVVEKEPDYMSRGHFYEGSKPFIDPTLVWKLPIGTKLYTTPPHREWRGLSEEEIADAQDAAAIQFRKSRHGVRGQQLMPSDSPDWWLARAIEQALKEKNA